MSADIVKRVGKLKILINNVLVALPYRRLCCVSYQLLLCINYQKLAGNENNNYSYLMFFVTYFHGLQTKRPTYISKSAFSFNIVVKRTM